MTLRDKIAIITGAASGIGYAIATQMAKEGAIIIVADINAAQAQKAVENINEYGKAFAYEIDVRNVQAVKKMVEDIVDEHGRLDYMFNNAGIAIMGEMMEMSLEQWDRLFDINVRGVIYGTHAACNVMKKQGFGHIVNTASLAGIIPSPNLGAYSGTKHAVLGICKSLRIEAREFGIKVSAICPGVIDTPMVTDSEIINEDQLAVSRKEIRENIQLTPYPVTKAARVIVKGVKKNKGIILVTGHAHFLSRLYRFFPSVSEMIGRLYHKREKNILAKKKQLYILYANYQERYMTPQDYFNICDIAHKSGFITKEQQQEILHVVQQFIQQKKEVPLVAILKKYGLQDAQFKSIQQQKERLFRQTVVSKQTQQQQQKDKELELSFSQTISPVESNKRIGKYSVIKLLGSGAMGSVYLVKDDDGKNFALKTMLPAVAETKVGLKRFQQEVNAMKMLRHANIIKIFEIGQQGNTHYFTMEYIEGKPLSDYVQDKMSARKIAYIIEKVARALDYAHSKNIIHRDIKPANIMISKSGEPIIMDFGLARQSQSDNRLTKTGAMLGTLAYMPPEQVKGNKREIDHQTDIYALGASMYELMTRQLPFSGQHLVVLRKIVQDEPTSPRELNNLIPEALERICLKAMAKKKEFRFASAMEMAEDLNRFLGGETIEAKLDKATLSKKGKVQILRFATAGVCLFCVLLLANIFTSQGSGENREEIRKEIAQQYEKWLSEARAKKTELFEENESLKKSLSEARAKKTELFEENKLLKSNSLYFVIDQLIEPTRNYVDGQKWESVLFQFKALLFFKEKWSAGHVKKMKEVLVKAIEHSYVEEDVYLKVDFVKTVWQACGYAVEHAEEGDKKYFMEYFLEICYNYAPLDKDPFSKAIMEKYDTLVEEYKWPYFLKIKVPKGVKKSELEELPEVSHKYYLLSDYHDELKRDAENRKTSIRYLETALNLNCNQPSYIQEMAKFYEKLHKLSAFTNKEYYEKHEQLISEGKKICHVYIKLLPIFQITLKSLNK